MIDQTIPKRKQRQNIAISILIIIIIACSLYISFQHYRTDKLNERIALQKEEITRLDLDNGAMSIKIDDIDGEIEKAHEEVVVAALTINYAKREIHNLTFYIEFLQGLLENNDIIYPYYVPAGSRE